ncbi:MAG: hypothetical protein KJ061_15205 [Vicinamibacteraceae bacterium]|nr:hypothetical protein [Vicinamibacteraceae bacterium]
MDETPLTGWKDIAAFLGTSVRTVQRFERELGLPVHRTRAAKGAVVRAYPSELRRWLAGRPGVEQAAVDPAPSEESVDDTAPERAIDDPAATQLVEDTTPGPARRGRRWVVSLAAAAAVVVSIAIVAWTWRSDEVGTPGLSGEALNLTVRPAKGSPIHLELPDGAHGEAIVAPGLALTLRPVTRTNGLLLDIGRRSVAGGSIQPLTQVRLVPGRPAHLSVEGAELDIEWDSADAGPARP